MPNIKKLIAVKMGADYGILSDQLFQFDPEINIEIKYYNNTIIITLSENDKYVDDFFGSTVKNISCIVGKNGVGKSTTLRYIKELFFKDDYRNKTDRNDIVIFRDGNTIQCYLNRKMRERVQIHNSTKYQDSYSYYINTPKLYDFLKDSTTIYYSNSLEDEKREIEPTNFYNISTNYLKDNIGKINRTLRNKKIRSQGGYKRWKTTDLIRQIKLLKDIDTKLSGLTIPFEKISHIRLDVLDIRRNDYEQIRTAIKKIHSNEYPESKKKEIQIRLFSDLEKIENLFKYEKTHASNANIHLGVYENYIVYLLKTIFKEIDGDIILYSNQDFISNLMSTILDTKLDEYGIRKAIINLPQAILHEYKDSTQAFNIQDTLDDINDSSILVIKFFDMLYTSEYSHKSLIINALKDDFLIFLDSYINVNSNFNFINLQWQELSAGELSLLSFFSRLYSISKDIKSSNILLLIDEGDLYFHPEWQRDYLFYLIQFFDAAFPNITNISVILTTHSPFILSDLPRENVILLKRDEIKNKSTILASDEDPFETFGGNIHTLFTTAFFMGDVTVSKFAKNKIQNDIIDPLQMENPLAERNNIWQLINKIGEPVLKSALIDLYKDRYDTL